MVLIVEDDAPTRRLYVEILRQVGVPCVATADPDQALRWASAQRFDAVVLDLGLPSVADGFWLASRLRALDDPPPIIAATGHFVAPEMARLFRATIHKPMDAVEIARIVQRTIGEQLRFDF